MVNRIAENSQTRQVLVKAVVQQFFDQVISELRKGNWLEFRDFGVFETKSTPARMAQPAEGLGQGGQVNKGRAEREWSRPGS